jgi:uncharacterized protein
LRIVDARARPPLRPFRIAYEERVRELAVESLESRGWEAPASISDADEARFREEMENAGIAMVGLPARVRNDLWDQTDNDEVLAVVAQEPRTFYSYLAVDPAAPDAPETVVRLAAAGARGIVVEPCLCDPPRALDDPRSDSVIEACEGVGLPVLLMAGGEAGEDIGHFHPLALERLATRFPRVQLVSVHAGWPWVQEAVGVAFRRPNVWLMPDCYFPNCPGEDDYVAAASTYLQDRFLFASGYPYSPIAATAGRYAELGFADEVLAKVMGENAVRLFGLEGLIG